MTLKRAAVLGHPIAHSLSPLIHNYWIARYALDAGYTAIDVLPDELGDTVRRLADEGYAGFNVTLPHKVAMMQVCDTVDALAQAVGAVNTVCIEDGKLHGTNTDVFGCMENLRRQCPAWQAGGGPVLVLGAGGAAQAVVHGLKENGVADIVVCNRSLDKAQAMTESQTGVTASPWDQRHNAARQAGLIINTTSLGMTGQPSLEIDLTGSQAVVYDIVYKPLMTPLLQQAKDLGLPVVTGLGMLLHQARPAFAAWFGVMPEVDDALATLALKAAS